MACEVGVENLQGVIAELTSYLKIGKLNLSWLDLT